MIWESVVTADFPKIGAFALVPCTVYLVNVLIILDVPMGFEQSNSALFEDS